MTFRVSTCPPNPFDRIGRKPLLSIKTTLMNRFRVNAGHFGNLLGTTPANHPGTMFFVQLFTDQFFMTSASVVTQVRFPQVTVIGVNYTNYLKIRK